MGFEVQFPEENCGKKRKPDGAVSPQESTDIVKSDHIKKGGFEHDS
ncbi:hypothetical protein RKLH11_156 [Rhodobacteraceae bacterium KLH11]|nr:hypothetical protein RKLH11_156 [Rhodobacteraceae bacterium KLH11]